MENFDDKMMYNEDELPSFEDYDELIDVECSQCGKMLSKDEILAHRYVGISDPEEMLCQKCWMNQVYEEPAKEFLK